MITVLKAEERGRASLGWLESRHTFSFGDYHDPGRLGFRSLRVINEDRVAGGGGFDTHPHRDMEILTYILSGALLHRDSLGHRAVMKAGEIQRITAGTGVEHSEFNYSTSEPVHLLQIWIEPEARGLAPAYEQKSFVDAPSGAMTLAASRSGRDGSIRLHQDASVYVGKFQKNLFDYPLAAGRGAWVQSTDGQLTVNGLTLEAGDGAAIEQETAVRLTAAGAAHFLLFDLP